MNAELVQGGDRVSATIDGSVLTIRVVLAGMTAPQATGRMTPLNAKGAETVGVELRALRRLVRDGQLPAVKMGRTTFFDAAALASLAKRPEPKPTCGSAIDPDQGYAHAVDAARARRERRGTNRPTQGQCA